jgi:hypothetical protein
MELDVDLRLLEENLLSEHGQHGGPNFAQAADAGERAIAAQGRIQGPDQLSRVLHGLIHAATAAGWKGGRLQAFFVDPDHDEGVAGREHALHGAIADAAITFPETNTETFRSTRSDDAPDDAVEFVPAVNGKGTAVTIRYLAGMNNMGAPGEMAQVLRTEGYEVIE